MKILITAETFLDLFIKYNEAIFPIQLLLVLLALALLYQNIKGLYPKINYTGYFLAGIWLWTGITYHLTLFTGINAKAYVFALLFIVQGLFLLKETYKQNLVFTFDKTLQNQIGILMILFSSIIYPFISYLIEKDLSKISSIGLPSPTIILTFGFLLLSKDLPKYLLFIPILWAIIGTWTAFDFGIYIDYFLTLAAALSYYFYILKNPEPIVSYV